MKNSIAIIFFLFISILVFGQVKSTNKSVRSKEEAALNRRYDECQLGVFNGETSMTITSASNTTDVRMITMEVSDMRIKCNGLEIKVGMSKAQIIKIAKNMGIEFLKKTTKYWLQPESGIIMKFQYEKLISIPGICLDVELLY